MDKTVWIVDDDEAILEVFQIILKEAGYDVVIIQDGRTIIKRLERERPALIFLDLLMSGIDGRDVSNNIKSNPATKNIPIIITSADTNIEQKTNEAHADSYLKKPFNIADVTKLVKKYLK